MPFRLEEATGVRPQHVAQVLRLLWGRDLPRVELARRLGLARSSMSDIVQGLLGAGLVSEGAPAETAATGRKSTLLTLQPRAAYLLAADVGARHLRVALLDLRCRPVAEREEPFDIRRGPQATYGALAGLVEHVLEQAGVSLARVALMGVGLPGPVDPASGQVADTPFMRGWGGEDVPGTLGRLFSVPVLIENDANLGALAEWYFGPHRGEDDLVYLKVGAGVGAGLLLGGRLHRGVHGGAGEIWPLLSGGRAAAASGGDRAIPAGRAADVGLLPDVLGEVLPGVSSTRLGPDSGLEDVIALLSEDDRAAQAVVQALGDRLGRLTASLLHLLNPSVVVIGGQVASVGAPLLDAVRRAVDARVPPLGRRGLELRLSTHGAEAGVLGLGALLLERLFSPAGLERLYKVTRLPPQPEVGTGILRSDPGWL